MPTNIVDEEIQIHDTLNPKLFDSNNHLKADARESLQNIADKLISSLQDDNIAIDIADIRIVGSNCAFNYTDDSDLDLHIVYNQTDELHELLYSAYNTIFNYNFNFTIRDIPIETFVEPVGKDSIEDDESNDMDAFDDDLVDVDTTPTLTAEQLAEKYRRPGALNSSGIYSVLHDTWIKEPDKINIPDIDYEAVATLLAEYDKQYAEIMEDPSISKIDTFRDKLHANRQEALNTEAGEFSVGNLAFKEFRNSGKLKRLKALKKQIQTAELSLFERFRKSNQQ